MRERKRSKLLSLYFTLGTSKFLLFTAKFLFSSFTSGLLSLVTTENLGIQVQCTKFFTQTTFNQHATEPSTFTLRLLIVAVVRFYKSERKEISNFD